MELSLSLPIGGEHGPVNARQGLSFCERRGEPIVHGRANAMIGYTIGPDPVAAGAARLLLDLSKCLEYLEKARLSYAGPLESLHGPCQRAPHSCPPRS